MRQPPKNSKFCVFFFKEALVNFQPYLEASVELSENPDGFDHEEKKIQIERSLRGAASDKRHFQGNF